MADDGRREQVPAAVQFDDKRVVARMQKKSLVPRKRTEREVELFAHLPQFDQARGNSPAE